MRSPSRTPAFCRALLQRALPEYFGAGLYTAPQRVAHAGDKHNADGTERTHAQLSDAVKKKLSAALSNDQTLYNAAVDLLHQRMQDGR